jgi:hypothetical protein
MCFVWELAMHDFALIGTAMGFVSFVVGDSLTA